MLDLGCGTGVVGLILGSLNKNISIDMVDVNERAIELARENIKLNNLDNNIFISDFYSNVNDKYDYIITNPPIRAGKDIVRGFLFDAKDYLSDNGTLFFVMRKDHGVKSMVKELDEIYKVEVVNKDKGFYIVKCLK